MPLNESEINTSLLNFVDEENLRYGGDFFAALTVESGYQGLEYVPFRSLFPLHVDNCPGTQLGRLIRSGHQTWIDRGFIWDAMRKKGPPLSLALMQSAVFPGRMESIRHLIRLREGLGGKLPVVLFPSTFNSELRASEGVFEERIFQPKKDVTDAWRIRISHRRSNAVALELVEQMLHRGYDGICFDTLHWRARRELPPWESALPLFKPWIKEVHIGLGRTDQLDSGIDSTAELKAFVNGGRTETGDMLCTMRDLGWSGRIVTEVPLRGLAGLHSHNPRRLTNNEITVAHGRIIAAIKDKVGML